MTRQGSINSNPFLETIKSFCKNKSFFTCQNITLENKGKLIQGRSEGTSSVAFEVLIINCQIDFINLMICNCLKANTNLVICYCLTSNSCFPKNISFASRSERKKSRRERLPMDARPYFPILNSPVKMMTSYNILRYPSLCTSIL